VLLLRTGEGDSVGDVRVPAGDEELRPGETMVVAGSREALERLHSL
jgi:Trk K+ transport system NAD-binding subunit